MMQTALCEEIDTLRTIASQAQKKLAKLQGDSSRPLIIDQAQRLLQKLTPYVGIQIEKASSDEPQDGVRITSVKANGSLVSCVSRILMRPLYPSVYIHI